MFKVNKIICLFTFIFILLWQTTFNNKIFESHLVNLQLLLNVLAFLFNLNMHKNNILTQAKTDQSI